MSKPLTMPTISQFDVIHTIKEWRDNEAEETLDTVLYFASALLGLSVDTIMAMLNE